MERTILSPYVPCLVRTSVGLVSRGLSLVTLDQGWHTTAHRQNGLAKVLFRLLFSFTIPEVCTRKSSGSRSIFYLMLVVTPSEYESEFRISHSN
jgi:hypothetical protein